MMGLLWCCNRLRRGFVTQACAKGSRSVTNDTEQQSISQGTRLALGAVAACVIAAAGYVLFPVEAIPPVGPITQAAPTAAAPPTPDTDDIAAAPEIEPQKPTPPAFDTFRVETDGTMVVAGRAGPGQTVDIMLGGQMIERITADSSGNFVAFPVAGPAETPRTLVLVADPNGAATRSEVSYIVAPIAAPQPALATEPTTTQPPTTATAPAIGSSGSTAEPPAAISQTPVATLRNDATPTLPTVLQADAEGIRVVQSPPPGPTPNDAPNVALDAITYDPDGAVQIAGRASGDGAVQIYLDNEPITASPVTQGGDWQIALPDVETGVYTLRIDELDQSGDVVSRIETPFKREVAQEVADAFADELAQDGVDVAVKTVQPGATLWAIAEANLGNGLFFVEVYEANADLIKDPDLIYPGQILNIPQVNE